MFQHISLTFLLVTLAAFGHPRDLSRQFHDPLTRDIHRCLRNVFDHVDAPASIQLIKSNGSRDYIPPVATIQSTKPLSGWSAYDYVETDVRLVGKSDLFVFIAETLHATTELVFENYPARSWNRRARFLFVVTHENRDSVDDINVFALNVLKLFVETFLVLIKVNNTDVLVRASHVQGCFASAQLEILRATDGCTTLKWLRTKLLNNVKLCTFNEQVYNSQFYRGPKPIRIGLVARNVVTFIADKLRLRWSNHSVEKLCCDYAVLPNRTELRQVSEEEALVEPTVNPWGINDPVNLTCMWLTPLGAFYPWDVLDFLYYDRVEWTVARQDKYLPNWRILIDIFTLRGWLMEIAIEMAMILTWIVMVNPTTFTLRLYLREFLPSMLASFASMLGYTIPFKSPTLRLRVLFMFWLFFTINFTVLVQSSYTKLLSNPRRQRQISTVDEVTTLNIYGHIQVEAAVKSALPAAKFFRVSHEDLEHKRATIYQQGGVIVLPHFYGISYIENNRDEFVKQTYPLPYIFREPLSYRYLSVTLSIKDHLLTDEFNRVIHLMHASGFLLNMMQSQITNALILLEAKWSDADMKPLTISSMQCPLLVLISGTIVSAVMFLFERKRKKMRGRERGSAVMERMKGYFVYEYMKHR